MPDYASALTAGANSFQTTTEHINLPQTLLWNDGVFGTSTLTNTSGVSPATGPLAVNAQGTPNMTVAVTAGHALVTATPTGQASQKIIANIAAQNATIAANSTGGTRYDHIYVAISATNANTPNAAGDNVSSIVVSRSTDAVTDNGTPPTYGYKIAVVTVANGASSITNGNISDKRTEVALRAADSVATANIQDDAVTMAKHYNPYLFRARRTSAFTTTSATYVKLTFNTEDYDYNNNYDNATNYRYTAPVAGVYHFNAYFRAPTTGFHIITLYKNGTRISVGSSDFYNTAQGITAEIADDLLLAAGDYIEVYVYTDGNQTVDVSDASIQPRFSGHLVHAT